MIEIHEITKIDEWFIDKICNHCRDGDMHLKTQELTPELLSRSKTYGVPG